jgi:hypothetical protein
VEDYEQLNKSTKYGDIGVTVKWIIYGKSVRERRSLGWIGQKMQIDKDTADKGEARSAVPFAVELLPGF